jgi:putative nucleotidyltransferase with HDIG domain
MWKKCILVLDCKPGDIIAQKIVSKYGATVAVENTQINNYIKNKLIAFEIEYIWVYQVSKEASIKLTDSTYLKIKTNYKQSVVEISNIINDLSRGKITEIQRINSILDSIYDSINDEYYIVKCLNELRATDQYLYNHCVNVSFYGMLLGKWLYLSKKEINDIIQAGLLHDIGKLKIPIEILNKKGKLDSQEFDEIKRHPIYGYNIVKDMPSIPDKIKEAILTHHERMDKSGYPLHKNGDDLSIYSKVIAIADVYDAITSERIYKKRQTPFEAFHILQNNLLGCFDIHMVNIFLGNLAACYVGSKVLLSNGEIGEIIYVPPHAITYPIIDTDSGYIDLFKNNNIKITSMI